MENELRNLKNRKHSAKAALEAERAHVAELAVTCAAVTKPAIYILDEGIDERKLELRILKE